MSSETNPSKPKFDIYQTYRKILQDEEVRHRPYILAEHFVCLSFDKDVAPSCSDLVAL